MNIFKSLFGGTPFIQRNGRDGCGPSVLRVTPPRGEDACDHKPQVSLTETLRGARVGSRSERDADQAKRDGTPAPSVRAAPSCGKVRAIHRCAAPMPTHRAPWDRMPTHRSGRGLGTGFAASASRPSATHRHAQRLLALPRSKARFGGGTSPPTPRAPSPRVPPDGRAWRRAIKARERGSLSRSRSPD